MSDAMKRRASLLLVPFVSVVIGASATSCLGESPWETMTGAEIYERRCENCHGPRGLAMKGLANSYAGKRKHWTKESLLEYLDDPTRYKKKLKHLRESKRFMPKQLIGVSDVARERVAEHVLTLMDALE